MTDDKIQVCPDCDSPKVHPRGSGLRDRQRRYRCRTCGWTGPTPERRAPNGNRTVSGPAKQLLDADDGSDLRNGGESA
ncbi:hypothetical protein [Halobaculum sp. P14]|uniref:hypothetical protein n=1 Tax=Halobaculum sp. P14 TaxID=3421638 RepID=UPI003EB9B7EB